MLYELRIHGGEALPSSSAAAVVALIQVKAIDFTSLERLSNVFAAGAAI